MDVDLITVIYRPDERLAPTLAALKDVSSEFRTLRLLVSGTRSEVATVSAQLAEAAMSSKTVLRHRFDNLGFASGNNILARDAFEAGASHVLLLNPDVFVSPGAIEVLLAMSARDGDRAIYGPALERVASDVRTKRTVDSMGIAWSRTGRHYDAMQGTEWNLDEGRTQTVAGVTGACMLVPQAVHDRIVEHSGYFLDDVFLAYREDAELGIRAKRAGIPSKVVEIGGYRHVRTVRGYTRGNELPDLLGVRNRFVMKWRLGDARPGSKVLATARDLLVVVATLLVERSSLPGLSSAFRIRRFLRS